MQLFFKFFSLFSCCFSRTNEVGFLIIYFSNCIIFSCFKGKRKRHKISTLLIFNLQRIVSQFSFLTCRLTSNFRTKFTIIYVFSFPPRLIQREKMFDAGKLVTRNLTLVFYYYLMCHCELSLEGYWSVSTKLG